MTAVSREGELIASEQMRDRIAAFLADEAALRGGREKKAGRLLFAMSIVVRSQPGRLAQPETTTTPVEKPKASLRKAIGELVSQCTDADGIEGFPDNGAELAALKDTINEIYACMEDGVFGYVL